MTRINIVDPIILTDQHLTAEYVETLMLCSNLQRTLNSKQGFNPKKVPKQYTLNTGHCYFFYNKGLYLSKRYSEIKNEMTRRNIKNDFEFPINKWPPELLNDWEPTTEDFNLIKNRISEKLNMKLGWYKYEKSPITSDFLKKYI